MSVRLRHFTQCENWGLTPLWLRDSAVYGMHLSTQCKICSWIFLSMMLQEKVRQWRHVIAWMWDVPHRLMCLNTHSSAEGAVFQGQETYWHERSWCFMATWWGWTGIAGVGSRLSFSLPGPPRCYQARLQVLTTPFLPYHKTASWNKSFFP